MPTVDFQLVVVGEIHQWIDQSFRRRYRSITDQSLSKTKQSAGSDVLRTDGHTQHGIVTAA